MKKLIEALHVIQDECAKNERGCKTCPLSSSEQSDYCALSESTPMQWKINDEFQKALL